MSAEYFAGNGGSMTADVHRVAELVAAGTPRSTVHARCRSGRWTRLLPGIVAMGEVHFGTLCRAVQLWQPKAVFSHRTAAHLLGFADEPETVEATVPRTANVRTPEWLVLHRRILPSGSVTLRHGWPVVTPDRAVLDCQTVLGRAQSDALADAACLRGLTRHSLSVGCERDRGVAGVVAARQQVRWTADGARSEPERLVGRALARRGMRLAANRSIRGWVVDLLDERSHTVVEIDGREVHSEPEVFRRDRRRQNALLGMGFHVLRYAAADVLADADEVAEDVLAVVRRRRAARR